MSIQYASNLSATRLPVAAPDPWVRPAEWMTLPTIPAGEQRIYILTAVFPGNPNYFAVRCVGNYRIDYGDGNGWVNYTSNTDANSQLLWASYANNPTTAEGWRQAIITIEPQSGADLTSVDFQRRHASTSTFYSTGFLDVQVSASNLTSMYVGAPVSNPQNGATVGTLFMQRFGVQGTTSITNAPSTFRYSGVRVVEGSAWTANIVTAISTFSNCSSLISLPNFDLTNLNDANSMFLSCSRLRSVPAFTFASMASTASMFLGCSSLTSVPLFNLSAATNTSQMFQNCSSLTSVPFFDLSASTNTSQMFRGCSSLTSVPLFDLSASTNTNQMFSGCSSLTSVPLFDLSASTNTSQMFRDCSRVTSASFNLSASTNTSDMFLNCSSLQSATFTNMGSVINSSNMFNGVTTLTSVTLGGLRYSVSVASNQLNAAALDALYTSLGTAVAAQAITVTGNPGTATDTPAIATGKSWTVTGS